MSEDDENTLNIYMQTNIMNSVNVATLSSIVWLLHWFPTPGLSALLMEKGLAKFLEWFSILQRHILADSRTDCSIFRKGGNRMDQPSDLVNEIELATTNFLTGDLIQCIPNWSMVTFGGCWSDVTTMIHYHDQLFPVLSDQALPPSVRIRSDFPGHSVLLTSSKNVRARVLVVLVVTLMKIF